MSGDDYWSDYNRGAAGLPPRNGMYYTWGEQAGRDTAFGNNNNNSGPGGGAALVLLGLALAAIVAIAAAAAVSAVLALPAAYLLIAITALFTGGHRPGFTEAYKTSFLGLVIATGLCMAVVLAVLEGWLPFMTPVAIAVYVLTGGIDVATLSASELTSAATGALMILTPGIVAFAVVLGKRIGRPYAGGLGFLRALAAALAVLIVPMLLFGAAAAFVATYGEPAVRMDELGEYLLVTLGLVFVMALAGGLLLGLLLMAFGGGLTRGGPMFRSAWFTGAAAMAIAGGTASLAILFFRDGDQMLQALIALSGAGRLQAAPAFADALPGFLKLTAPGAAAGAMFVAGSLYAYRGLLGWVKAFLITVPFALAALSGTIMLLAQLR